jgi:TolB-like protein
MPSLTFSVFHDVSTRKVWTSGALLTCLLLAVNLPAAPQQREVQDMSARLAEKIANSGKKTVAVVDFTDLQGNVTELGRYLAEEFSVALEESAKNFQVIDRTHLKAILQEHQLATSGIIDPGTARKLGQIAGVEALVTGTITPFGDTVNVSVKALDPATAVMIGAARGDIAKTPAINEILNKGIEQTGKQPHPPLPPNQTVVVDDIEFGVKSCEWSGTTLVCRLALTNRSQEDRQLEFEVSRMIDDSGNEYRCERCRFGSKENRCYPFWASLENTLVSGTPTNLVITYARVPAEATRVSLLEVTARLGPGGYQHDLVAHVRNIPITR